MIKKVVKYSKFILSIALIFSLNLPSFATLNMADGSAFITKTEFDNAIIDFYNRLNTFEAGLNTKIDAQVSSYLDRNGIWNGSHQSLVKNKYEKDFLVVLGVTKGNGTSYTHNNKDVSDYKQYKSASYTDVLQIANGVSSHKENIGDLIIGVNKTGLMNVVGSYGDGSEHRICLIRKSNDYKMDGCLTIRLIYKLQKNNTGDDNTVWNGQWVWENNTNEAFYSNYNDVYVRWPVINFSAYFFVNKGDNIFVEFEGAILSQSSSARVPSNETVVMNVKEAQVY